MIPSKSMWVTGMVLCWLVGCACSSNTAKECQVDTDCSGLQICQEGHCVAPSWDGADGEDGTAADSGGDAGSDPGSDPGTEAGADLVEDSGADSGESDSSGPQKCFFEQECEPYQICSSMGECVTNIVQQSCVDCPDNSTCLGNYGCVCNQGYAATGANACRDINECTEKLDVLYQCGNGNENCSTDYSLPCCINLPGSYICRCVSFPDCPAYEQCCDGCCEHSPPDPWLFIHLCDANYRDCNDPGDPLAYEKGGCESFVGSTNGRCCWQGGTDIDLEMQGIYISSTRGGEYALAVNALLPISGAVCAEDFATIVSGGSPAALTWKRPCSPNDSLRNEVGGIDKRDLVLILGDQGQRRLNFYGTLVESVTPANIDDCWTQGQPDRGYETFSFTADTMEVQ